MDRRYRCGECGMGFASLSDLVAHMENQDEECA